MSQTFYFILFIFGRAVSLLLGRLCCQGEWGFSLVAVCRLLIAVASLVEHGLEDTWASVTVARGSLVAAPTL